MFKEKPEKITPDEVDVKWYIVWILVPVVELITFRLTDLHQIMVPIIIVTLIFFIVGLLLIILIDHKKKSTQIFDSATEREIYNYLKAHIGKAYTAKILIDRIGENINHRYFKKYFKENGDMILNKMVSKEVVQITHKDDKSFYLISKGS